MNFIEVLKSVGGDKPCGKCEGIGQYDGPPTKTNSLGGGICEVCHGTGQIIDLAPLLAKPKELSDVVGEYDNANKNTLLSKLSRQPLTDNISCLWRLREERPELYVIGPQRAHSLVYEVARQLGGTAVVVTSPNYLLENASNYFAKMSTSNLAFSDENGFKRLLLEESKVRISLPIPDNATVLFVTDRYDEQEMDWIIRTTWNPDMKTLLPTMLPYVLSLVSGTEIHRVPWIIDQGFKIISLHQESK
jgi:hypothetical protein